jgi:hypothetical protein
MKKRTMDKIDFATLQDEENITICEFNVKLVISKKRLKEALQPFCSMLND